LDPRTSKEIFSLGVEKRAGGGSGRIGPQKRKRSRVMSEPKIESGVEKIQGKS